MSIRVKLHHVSEYTYDELISLGPQIVRLRPAPQCRTPILSYSLKVEPVDHFVNWQQDPHGNHQARFVFTKPTRRLVVSVDVVADMTVINPFDFFIEQSADSFPFDYEESLARELRPFLERGKLGPKGREFLQSIDRTSRHTTDFLVALNQRVQNEITYLIRMEPGVQTPEETLELGKGSCRDSAWLLVQMMRHLGLAARFVSGYLIQLVPDIKSLDGPSGPEADFTDLHAWAEAYIPGAGWIGLDPTSGLLAGEGHIPLACTPEPQTAAPISGTLDPCKVEFQFSMEVSRIHEDPRVTKPYTAEQWQAIDTLGQKIDDRLADGDVRLTMGGEPTFVSIDDMDGDEWNSAAVGPDKRRLSEILIKRLRTRFAPGGLLHFGQGKWYPGESLPRWALACYWRRDGQPIWENPELIADTHINYGYGVKEAKRFMHRLAKTLGVSRKWITQAYEDVIHYFGKEQRLPINLAPGDPRLKDPEDRARLARVFERGLNHPVGFVMPLQMQWWQGRARWMTGPWLVRSEKLQLLPGDSPIGLRLPLDSLPWLPKSQVPEFIPRDPSVATGPLPMPNYRAQPHTGLRPEEGSYPQPISEQTLATPEQLQKFNTAALLAALLPHDDALPDKDALSEKAEELEEEEEEDEDDVEDGDFLTGIRTALCVEPRDGRIHVFLPPVQALEEYLDVVAAIETTAAELRMPVVIEGYLPPSDSRVNQLKVTPDPGVIEVNIHPASSWSEMVDVTTKLYEEARWTRLGTEKFDLDGKHSGTGGGNHVVLGSTTTLDSPFLRRPDLLRSLVGYWVNHPSLSYLFSGRFVGPTSQAPRVDEGRKDALYELELAFASIPNDGSPCPPWLVDRIFRNLLIDLTGNTHRAEFCIDKLYSPDSSSGRLGLAEMRGFEMPPHAQMSLTQQLLIRALVSLFWDKPYRQPLIDWGTTLHDRFLLPHFVWQDLGEVIDDLNRDGIPMERAWFASHFEFRFPKIGDLFLGDIGLELRSAIEPWYVLGEESAAGATVRFVDSSVERLQVKVEGMIGIRYAIACNGRRVPMNPTGVPGEYAAGVRYRAWNPPNALHPAIPVHTPLVFDILDTWSGRSIGGCTYHVAHPAGRNYQTFPVNAYEAEARRTARFFRTGHTPGTMPIPPEELNRAYPLTLDLRRAATPR